jgi:hypothetical protein
VLHQPAAHSDGDVLVFFRRSDVVMAGDVLDTLHFPVIDVERGGTMSKIRILLAEDHEIVRKGIRSLFERRTDLDVVGEAENGRQAVILAGEQYRRSCAVRRR